MQRKVLIKIIDVRIDHINTFLCCSLQDHAEEGVDMVDADVNDFDHVINEDELEDEVFEIDDTEQNQAFEIQNLIHDRNCSEA